MRERRGDRRKGEREGERNRDSSVHKSNILHCITCIFSCKLDESLNVTPWLRACKEFAVIVAHYRPRFCLPTPPFPPPPPPLSSRSPPLSPRTPRTSTAPPRPPSPEYGGRGNSRCTRTTCRAGFWRERRRRERSFGGGGGRAPPLEKEEKKTTKVLRLLRLRLLRGGSSERGK